MGYSKIKNVVFAVVPVLVYYVYQAVQVRVQMNASMTFDRLSLTLFNLAAPCAVGVFAFAAIAYAWQNRNSLVFISMFCGAFLVNLLSVAYMLALFGLRPVAMGMSGGSQVANVLMGAYGAGFWVSLVSYIRGRKHPIQ